MKKTATVKKVTKKKPAPAMETLPGQGKYHLRSLHQEIDLYDRKLAYLANFEIFNSDEDRAEAAKKLQNKRATLESAARRMAAEGVEFNPDELPRSFRAHPAETAKHA